MPDLINFWIKLVAVTGPLKEKQIAYVCRETLQVRLCLWKLPCFQSEYSNTTRMMHMWLSFTKKETVQKLFN